MSVPIFGFALGVGISIVGGYSHSDTMYTEKIETSGSAFDESLNY